MSVWSVDSIVKVHQDAANQNEQDFIFRIIKYHENIEINPGTRYFITNVNPERFINWGSSYTLQSRMLDNIIKDGRLIRLTSFEGFERALDVEEVLRSSGEAAFSGSRNTNVNIIASPDATRIVRGTTAPTCWAKIHVHNVGQGDTIVLELPDNQFWLVDARLWGNSRRTAFKDWVRINFGHDMTFDKVIATHMHYDHIHSIPFILSTYHVNEVLIPDSLVHPTSSARRVWEMAGPRLRTGITSIIHRWGDLEVQITQTNSIPSIRNRINRSSDPNDHELAIVMQTPSSWAFLSGDIPGDICNVVLQNSIINNPAETINRYYKVSHHGSNTGYDALFFNAYPANHAIISCSATNRYGHPHTPPKGHFRSPCQITYRDGLPVYSYCLQ